jgi:hypothetical protein
MATDSLDGLSPEDRDRVILGCRARYLFHPDLVAASSGTRCPRLRRAQARAIAGYPGSGQGGHGQCSKLRLTGAA